MAMDSLSERRHSLNEGMTSIARTFSSLLLCTLSIEVKRQFTVILYKELAQRDVETLPNHTPSLSFGSSMTAELMADLSWKGRTSDPADRIPDSLLES
jgi:hypothetical protein